MILIEYPHRGPRRVWSVGNEKTLLAIVAQLSPASISAENYNLETVSGAIDWLGHDLKNLKILSKSSDLAGWENDEKVMAEADKLGWATSQAFYQHPDIPGTYTLEHWLTEYPDVSPYALIEVAKTESGDFEPVSQMFARH